MVVVSTEVVVPVLVWVTPFELIVDVTGQTVVVVKTFTVVVAPSGTFVVSVEVVVPVVVYTTPFDMNVDSYGPTVVDLRTNAVNTIPLVVLVPGFKVATLVLEVWDELLKLDTDVTVLLCVVPLVELIVEDVEAIEGWLIEALEVEVALVLTEDEILNKPV
jgi:mannitol-specific phosphotransferase system IIBC component